MTAAWESKRFGRRVHLTRHALERMGRRGISRACVEDLIETGTIKWKDDEHCWIFKAYADRDDNLVCAAVLCRQAVIVKTLMTHWEESQA